MKNEFTQYTTYIHYDARHDELRYPDICVYEGYVQEEGEDYGYHHFFDPDSGVYNVSLSDNHEHDDMSEHTDELYEQLCNQVTNGRKKTIMKYCRNKPDGFSLDNVSKEELHRMFYDVERTGRLNTEPHHYGVHDYKWGDTNEIANID